MEYTTVETLGRYVCGMLDRAVDGSKATPLSLGQQVVYTNGLAEDFIYHEIILPGLCSTGALLVAWREVVSRHAALRTVVSGFWMS